MSDKKMQEMADAVAHLINSKGLSYKNSFAKVAHQYGIWHHELPARYNYFFKQVMARVKKIIGRETLVRACQGKTRRKKTLPMPTKQIQLSID